MGNCLHSADAATPKVVSNSSSGCDTIYRAARRGDLEAVRRFVETEGVDIDCIEEDSPRDTLLTAVVREPTSPAMRSLMYYLISKGADVNATDGCFGHTALMEACRWGKLHAVTILLEEGGADVNFERSSTGCTALSYATNHISGLRVVPTLLYYGANVNPDTPNNRSPLLRACRHYGASKIVEQLLERGANVEKENPYGGTALHLAVVNSDEATVRLLIAYGANVNRRANTLRRVPPLWRAAARGYRDKVRALLEHNAKVDMLGDNGGTVLHYMARYPFTEQILVMLLKHSRDTMTEDAFSNFLLAEKRNEGTALNYNYYSVSSARLLIEQPRRQDTQQLLHVCRSLLVSGLQRLPAADEREESNRVSKYVAYLKSFESLPLSVPAVPAYDSSAKEHQWQTMEDCTPVKLNPALNNFQQSVADEALELIMDTTECPDSVAHAILGYLSVVDAMKRDIA